VLNFGPEDLYNGVEVKTLHFSHSSLRSRLSYPLLPIFLIASLFAMSGPALAKRSFEERYALAEKHRSSGDYSEALREYTSLVKVRPADSRMHANLGSVLVRTGKVKEGKEEIDKAIMLNEEDPAAHRAMATYYMFCKDKSKARMEYARATALEPGQNEPANDLQAFLGLAPAKTPTQRPKRKGQDQ
jgi:Tfp pilus assembly protein PilF